MAWRCTAALSTRTPRLRLLYCQLLLGQRGNSVPPAGETFDAVSNELTFFTLPNCWELFGFDLMLDENWHVWLLEVGSSC